MMWPFGESSIDKALREKDERWDKAKSRLQGTETLICIISGRHAVYKDKKGFLKSFDINEEE